MDILWALGNRTLEHDDRQQEKNHRYTRTKKVCCQRKRFRSKIFTFSSPKIWSSTCEGSMLMASAS